MLIWLLVVIAVFYFFFTTKNRKKAKKEIIENVEIVIDKANQSPEIEDFLNNYSKNLDNDTLYQGLNDQEIMDGASPVFEQLPYKDVPVNLVNEEEKRLVKIQAEVANKYYDIGQISYETIAANNFKIENVFRTELSIAGGKYKDTVKDEHGNPYIEIFESHELEVTIKFFVA